MDYADYLVRDEKIHRKTKQRAIHYNNLESAACVIQSFLPL